MTKPAKFLLKTSSKIGLTSFFSLQITLDLHIGNRIHPVSYMEVKCYLKAKKLRSKFCFLQNDNVLAK